MRKEYQSMTLWRSQGYDRRQVVKTPWPDVYRTKPGYMGKAGIAGAFEQPARYLATRAYEWYQPERRIQALRWKAQREVPPWLKGKFFNWYSGYNNYVLEDADLCEEV